MVARTNAPVAPSLDDIIAAAVKAAVAQYATANVPAVEAPDQESGNYFIGTVSKVAVHKLGLQMRESENRYWNVAKDARPPHGAITYDGVSEGARIRLVLDDNERVIGWTPADAPLPSGRGRKSQASKPAKGANNGKGQTGKGAAKAASNPPTEAFVPEAKQPMSAAETLRIRAAEMVAAHRHANGVNGDCPFCGSRHAKYTAEQIGLTCLKEQFKKVGRAYTLTDGVDLEEIGQWLQSHYLPVYSYNARGFEILGPESSETAEAAPAASAPTLAPEPTKPTPTKSGPAQCAEDGCHIFVARDLKFCAKHNGITKQTPGGKASQQAPKEEAKASSPKVPTAPTQTTSAATATTTASASVKSDTSRSKREVALVSMEAPKSADATFRAIIDRFPTKKVRMVKLARFDGEGSPTWYEFDSSLDIARCDPGAIVDVTIRVEPATQSARLVDYTLVEKAPTTKGVETSGKQAPPAPKVKHVSNRQRNAARSHKQEKVARQEAKPTHPLAEYVALVEGVSIEEANATCAAAEADMATESTDDPDAIFAARTAQRRLERLSQENAPKREPSGIPGISVRPDPKTGAPTFVVDNAKKRGGGRRKTQPVGLVGEECNDCGRRFSMAGYSSVPGICGRCLPVE